MPGGCGMVESFLDLLLSEGAIGVASHIRPVSTITVVVLCPDTKFYFLSTCLQGCHHLAVR